MQKRGVEMEEIFNVKTIGVKYICDSCKEGEMQQTGKMKMYDNHANFIHKCDNCGHEIELREKYPLVRYEQM